MLISAPCVYIKAGPHAGETLEQIVGRKRRELTQAGKIFWGYNGTLCHPLTQVVPFVARHGSSTSPVQVVMPITAGSGTPTEAGKQYLAQEFSQDGRRWEKIPDGIRVTGSKYALVLEELSLCNAPFLLEEYCVGIGPSEGRNAAEYVKARIDKACLIPISQRSTPVLDGKPHSIRLIGKLAAPYAVFVR